MDTFVEQIPTMAEMHRELSKRHFGMELDYSPESLALVDAAIAEHFPPGEAPAMQSTVMTIGAYVGEVFRRRFGGEWVEDGDNGLGLRLAEGAVTIYPFSKVQKRFINGEQDALGDFFQAVVAALPPE